MLKYKLSIINLCLAVLTLSGSAFCFEIKPQFKDHCEWFDKRLDISQYKKANQSCNDLLYKAFETEPVHEMVTYHAIYNICHDLGPEGSGEINKSGIFKNICSYVPHKSQRFITNGNDAKRNPLLAGVIFNDDPDFKLSKGDYSLAGLIYGGIIEARSVQSIIEGKEKDATSYLTYRSHMGDLQFLHAMKSSIKSKSGDKPEYIDSQSENDAETKQKITNYITANYILAKKFDNLITQASVLENSTDDSGVFLNINKEKAKKNQDSNYALSALGHLQSLLYTDLDNLTKEKGPFGEYSKEFLFLKPAVKRQNCHIIKDLFACDTKGTKRWIAKNSDENNEDYGTNTDIRNAREVALRALGSALHLIQDSYSVSHTSRMTDSHAITSFKTYDEENRKGHCIFDQLSISNDGNIQSAYVASKDFLEVFIKNEKQCSSVETGDKVMECWKNELEEKHLSKHMKMAD